MEQASAYTSNPFNRVLGTFLGLGLVKFDPKLLKNGFKSPGISSLAPQMIFVRPSWMLMAADACGRLENMIGGKIQGMQDLCYAEIGQI